MQVVDTLLVTKLFVPAPRPSLAPRQRLTHIFNGTLTSRLTLVSAPAGYGKTTLTASWLVEQETPFGWLSLDGGDNDPARFLAYLIAALQTAVPGIGADAISLIHAPQPPLQEALVALVNDLAAHPQPLLLILDDYHTITELAVHDVVTFLLNRAPPHCHLLILTRADPPLPLSRLRARAQLVEIRQEDLRFVDEEAAVFFNELNRLGLTETQVAALVARTEGWIAGLQMAALALQSQEDNSAFIDRFAGTHHYIIDYLADEVLARRPPDTRDFLLQTSILDRLSASLCDAVTGRDDSQVLLAELLRSNLFLLPLDEERRWYRYHHLFAHLLQQRLQETAPETVPDLHRLAARWYRENDLAPTAVGHLLTAADFAAAADLIATIANPIIGRGEHATLAGWLDKLPAELVTARPRLSLIAAWQLHAARRFSDVETHLQTVEQTLSTIADEAERNDIRGQIAVHRANSMSLQGDYQPAAKLAQAAVNLLAPQNHFYRGVAYLILGGAGRFLDDLVTAETALAQGMAISWESKDIIGFVVTAYNLAQLHISKGALTKAASILERALRRTTVQKQTLSIAGVLYIGLARIDYQHNQLDQALQNLQTGLALLEKTSARIEEVVGYLTQARILGIQGEYERAWTAVHKAADATSDAGFNRDRVEIARARLHLQQGNLAAVAHWAKRRDPAAVMEKKPLHVTERLLLAHFYLAREQMADAHDVLQEEREDAVRSERMGDLVSILATLAIVHSAQGTEVAALTTLEEALRLGDPENFVRPFIDLGQPMVKLLRAAAADGIFLDYVTRLLAAFPDKDEDRTAVTALVEPLSERELEVLRLIAAGLTNREIAQQLVIAHGTAKRHVSNIYGKLNVGNRTQAVARARELRLL